MVDIVNIGMRVDSSSVRKGRDDLESFGGQSVKTKKATDRLIDTFGKLTVAVGSLSGVYFSVIKPHREFTKSLSELSAITGAAGNDLLFMKEQAIALGASTTFSANEVAESFKLMASAKPDLLESKEALVSVTKEVLALSEASGMALPNAAMALGSAMNQFKAGSSEASRFINVLAAGAKFGASEIDQTAEALKNSGAVASSLGVSFEEVNAAIQAMASISIKGAEAGTGLRSVLLKLANQSNSKFNPEIVGLSDALVNLKNANLTTTEKTKLFGLESITAATAVIEQADAVAELTENLTDTNTAYEQASINMNNLDGDIKSMSSSWSTAALIIGDSLDPALRIIAVTLSGLGKMAQIAAIEFGDLGNLLGSYAAQTAALATLDIEQFNLIGDMRKEERKAIDEKIRLITGEATEYEKLIIAQERLAQLKGDFSFSAMQERNNLIAEIALRERNIEKIGKETEEIEKKIAASGISSAKATRSFFEDDSSGGKSTVDASKAIIASLREQAQTFGMTAEQIAIHRLALSGATVEQISEAKDLADKIANLKSVAMTRDSDFEVYKSDLAKEEEALAVSFGVRSALIIEQLESKEISEAESRERLLALEQDYYDKLHNIDSDYFEKKKALTMEWSEMWMNAQNTFSSGMGSAAADVIVDQKNVGDAVEGVFKSIAKQAIQTYTTTRLQQMINHATAETIKAKETATSVASAGTVAAAWAPAAAATSVASFGSSAAAGIAGLIAIAALSSKLFGGSGGGGSSPSVASSTAPSLPAPPQQTQPQPQVSVFVLGGSGEAPDMDSIMDRLSIAVNEEDRQVFNVESRQVQDIIEAVKA